MAKRKHYTLEEIEREIGKFQNEDDSKKSKTMGMMLIASYGKIFNITDSGIKKALELMEKYENDSVQILEFTKEVKKVDLKLKKLMIH